MVNEEIKKIEEKNKFQEARQIPEYNKKKTNWVQLFLLFVVFGIICVFMFWTSRVSNVDNSMLIMWLVLSVLANILIVLIVFGTGIGIELTKRFFNKFKYKSGNYVNSLHLMKSGVGKERFCKRDKETGGFRMEDQPYVTNPTLMFIFKGIPTYLHRDGNPDPLNIWQDELAGDLSNAEMDTAMNSKGAFDVKLWLEKNKTIVFIALFIVIGCTIASIFFGYQIWEMLREGTYNQLKEVTCKNIPKAVEIVETAIGGV